MIIDVIAPSGSFPAADVAALRAYIESKGHTARIPDQILGPDLLAANSDAERFKQLKAALYAEDSTIIWCVRGGYGATRLLPDLQALPPPKHQKILIGFSDITALHLFLSQKWGWPTLHGASLRQMAKADLNAHSIQLTEALVFEKKPIINYALMPMNPAAQNSISIEAALTGGNLKLLEASLGTSWQINTQPKILILEEINEYDYRVDRSLVHLAQAQVFESVSAIILGDFTHEFPAHEAKLEAVLKRFAHEIRLPVFRRPGIGHGTENLPWLYAPAQLNASRLIQI
ncbi:MAG: LD-carboxypeptidase [Gammaproteobacteria bacterium]|jgi:muramoyltetrapeptide carboxypeptidase|nr:LD-carboxypeptidase [Gammaproteobacteria bacterium]